MTVNDVLLIRHGQTDANRASVMQGHTDTELNARGILQMEALATYWSASVTGSVVVVASPLKRAMASARIFAGQLEAPVRQERGLMERACGDWEGLDAAEAHRLERDYAKTHRCAPFDVVAPNGESTQQMATRVNLSFDHLVQTTKAATLVLVTHGGPIGAIVCHVLGVPYSPETLAAFKRSNAGVTRFVHNDGKLRVDFMNNRAHLAKKEHLNSLLTTTA